MNNALKLLMAEHDLIVEAAQVATHLKNLLQDDGEEYEIACRKLIRFFREYADEYHHHKEEILLFPELARKNEILETGIISEMLENHSDFRSTLSEIERGLDRKEYLAANDALQFYIEDLLDHIAVENAEVFEIADTLLDEEELERISFSFNDVDRDLGAERKRELAKMINDLRREIETLGVE